MGKPRGSTARATKPKTGTKRRAIPLRDGMLPMTNANEDLMRVRSVKVTEPLRALTAAQADYMAMISSKDLIFGIGPAGTGKTHVAATMVADAFVAGECDSIIITRPAVEAGEKLGFMPGDMNEKMDSYMAPLIEALNKRLGRSHVELLIKSKKIEVLPLAFMRGRSLEKTLVIFDEAQNATKTQMKMFLTRIGQGARFIVDGDPTQIDLPDPRHSGLLDAVDRVQDLPGVGVVRFTEDDIVRSGLCQMIVKAYSKSAS